MNAISRILAGGERFARHWPGTAWILAGVAAGHGRVKEKLNWVRTE